jgi:diadenosine tetraphosphate (Ap4A) HIT family hydrolase
MMNQVACIHCQFQLWNPISTLQFSAVGLYDDSRFPGRCIVLLDHHAENFEDLDEDIAAEFMKDVRAVAQALKAVTGSQRINIAILGNAEPHVHAHLIPRFPDNEDFPNSSPWDDPRPKTKLSGDERIALIHDISKSLI